MSRKLSYSGFGSVYGIEELKAVVDFLFGVIHKEKPLTCGPLTEKFEDEFAKYVGVKYAFACSNCTAALYLATAALNIKSNDEIIVTPITFIATSLPLLQVKATPVFVDIDPVTFNIDPDKIEKKITKKTKAIYLVHYGGQPADMDSIMELAKKYNLSVVEDAAHAVGSKYKGKIIGSLGNLTCFSFHSQKNMTTLGEGGMITTNSKKCAEKISLIRSLGYSPITWDSSYYPHDIMDADGYIPNNYRMSEIQAAVGLIQLKKINQLNNRRIEIANYLTEKLNNIEEITTPYEKKDYKNVYHLYPIQFNGERINRKKADFLNALEEEGIGYGRHYLPSYLFSIYKKRGYNQGLCPISEKIFSKLVNLPIHPRLTQKDLDFMIKGIKSAIQKLRR